MKRNKKDKQSFFKHVRVRKFSHLRVGNNRSLAHEAATWLWRSGLQARVRPKRSRLRRP
jgi:hypothetical protein